MGHLSQIASLPGLLFQGRQSQSGGECQSSQDELLGQANLQSLVVRGHLALEQVDHPLQQLRRHRPKELGQVSGHLQTTGGCLEGEIGFS